MFYRIKLFFSTIIGRIYSLFGNNLTTDNRYNFIKEVLRSHNYYLNKEEEIEFLYSEANENQYSLLKSLLKRFHHVEASDLDNYRMDIANQILQIKGSDTNNTIITPLAFDEDPDSSLRCIDHIRVALEKLGASNYRIVNHFTRLQSILTTGTKENKSYHIVLVDEFSGSGQTIINRYKAIQHYNNISSINIFMYAGMKQAYDYIKKQKPHFNVHFSEILYKGISDHYTGLEKYNNISQMIALEDSLKYRMGQKLLKDYTLGFNFAEALYNNDIVFGNTPNSVFPIFWWKKNKLDQNRKRLLIRSEKDL